MLERFNRDLASLSEAIRSSDGDRILQIFSEAKSARDGFAG